MNRHKAESNQEEEILRADKTLLILSNKSKAEWKKRIECFAIHRAADYACKPQNISQIINPSKDKGIN